MFQLREINQMEQDVSVPGFGAQHHTSTHTHPSALDTPEPSYFVPRFVGLAAVAGGHDRRQRQGSLARHLFGPVDSGAGGPKDIRIRRPFSKVALSSSVFYPYHRILIIADYLFPASAGFRG